MRNFHLTLEDFLDEDNVNNIYSHICLLFAGKLNYFGTDQWEKHCLPYYKYALEHLDRQNVKVTAKFIVYDVDEHLPGNYATLLSGYGNIYPLLFDNITDSEFIKSKRQNPLFKNDIDKYKKIHEWVVASKFECKIKKHYFESYCKNIFDFVDNHSFYYVNSEYNLSRAKEILGNNEIDSLYSFGQHFQINNAYEHYHDMFEDCNENTLIFKIRYDAHIQILPEKNTFKNLMNVFYNACNDKILRTEAQQSFMVNYNYNNMPTVMYTGMYPLKSVRINFFLDDIMIIFNSEGIKKYAKNYADWILDISIETFNPNNEPHIKNNFVGLNIHASLGQFFLYNYFNTIDYIPFLHGYMQLFGAPLRTKPLIELDSLRLRLTDIYDDYKLRWYHGQWAIRSKIIERFGKNDNT